MLNILTTLKEDLKNKKVWYWLMEGEAWGLWAVGRAGSRCSWDVGFL